MCEIFPEKSFFPLGICVFLLTEAELSHMILTKNISKNLQYVKRGVFTLTKTIKITSIQSLENEKKRVLRLEMDYELATLFEAMEENNRSKKQKSIEKLEQLREELIHLGGFNQ